MDIKISYKKELGLPELNAVNNSDKESPMTILVQCNEGKKRNAESTVNETVLAMLFATRGLYNMFDSDIETIEIDGVQGLTKSFVQDNRQKTGEGQLIFHSRYRVCNWKVTKGNISEFFYLTHNDNEDSKYGVLKHRKAFAKDLNKEILGANSCDIAENIERNTQIIMISQLKAVLSSLKNGLNIVSSKNVDGKTQIFFSYKGELIQNEDDAEKYILDDEAYTLYLFTNLLLSRAVQQERYDMIYIDGKEFKTSTLNAFRMIGGVIKRNNNVSAEQSITIVIYNVSQVQIRSMNKNGKECQVINLINSRDTREQKNLGSKKF